MIHGYGSGGSGWILYKRSKETFNGMVYKSFRFWKLFQCERDIRPLKIYYQIKISYILSFIVSLFSSQCSGNIEKKHIEIGRRD